MVKVDRSTEQVVKKAVNELGFDPTSPAEGFRILEVTGRGRETFRVQITATQRFTFGPFAPGSRGGDLALRIYEGAAKDNQVAVFRDVESVRDIAVLMAKRIGTSKGEKKFEFNADGSKNESIVETDEEWVAF